MTTYTNEQIEKITKLGSLWTSSDGSKRRVYFNDNERRMLRAEQMRVSYYNSGNISSASQFNSLTGQYEAISNAAAKRAFAAMPAKLWFDLDSHKFEWKDAGRSIAMGIVNDIKREIGIEIPAE